MMYNINGIVNGIFKKRRKAMKAIKKAISICCAAAMCSTLAVVPAKAAGQSVVINEICAKNTSYAADDGSYYDWIELYNPTSGNVDLSGYGLSDKETNPFKFTFPTGSTIGSGQRIIVFCDSTISESAGRFTAKFGLSTSGETVSLTSPDGNVIDTVTFGQIETNVSYGRVTDGSDELGYLTATPLAANEKRNVISIDVPEPEFSNAPGFYSSGFELTINAPQGTKVYYTLDGSTPTASSTAYSSPISVTDITSQPNNLSAITDIKPSSWGSSGVTAPTDPVDKAFIVNAVAIDSEGNVSDVVSSAYFIGYDNRASYYKNMKVISIVTDSDNLFDHEKGIYVLGKVYDDWKAQNSGGMGVQEWMIPANYTQKGAAWERPASMQIFDDGQLAHTQNVGIRIHGGATRSSAQKSFNVYARSEYGASKLDFDLFSGNLRSESTGKKIKEFDTFMLRNGGNDGSYTRFRDKLNQSLVADRDMLTQAMEPAIVFINGEFWGHYEITEKIDEDFVDAHYKVGKKNVCIVKNQELDAGDEETFAEWEQLYNWVKSTDFSNASNYSELCSRIDMQSFADYMSAEIYFGNQDWGDNNTAMWKSTVSDPSNEFSDGKWRFILFDTEYSANLYGQIAPSTNTFTQVSNKDCFVAALLKGALKNDEFKSQFVRTFMDLSNENFKSERISSFINDLSAEYKDFVIDTRERFEPRTAVSQPNEPAQPGEPGGWGGGFGDWGGGFGDWGGIGGGAQQSHEDGYRSDVNTVSSYYSSRGQSIVNNLRSYCQLRGNLANITVQNDQSSGQVKINTLTPDFTSGSWTGSYYTDYPVILNAVPAEGVEFDHWELSNGKTINSPTAEVELTGDVTVKAVYGQSTILYGDVNLDGAVNVSDLAALQEHLLGKKALTSEQLGSADVLRDGKVDTFDMVALRKKIVG